MTAETIMDDNERTNRYLRRLSFVFGFLLLVSSGIGAASTVKLVDEAKEQSEHNGRLMSVMLAVSGCTTTDTPEMCQQRQVDRSIDEGVRRIIEVDCRLRRALADLPAPEPLQPCILPKEPQ